MPTGRRKRSSEERRQRRAPSGQSGSSGQSASNSQQPQQPAAKNAPTPPGQFAMGNYNVTPPPQAAPQRAGQPFRPASGAHNFERPHTPPRLTPTPQTRSPNRKALSPSINDALGRIMRLPQLVRDGRKPPQYFRELYSRVSTPSQLSFEGCTERFKLGPACQFQTIDDVYRYRGYRKMSKLDEGAFGVVSKAQRLGDGLVVAVKEIDLTKKRAKRIDEVKRELFVLQKMQEKTIVQLMESFVIDDLLVIVMEFCAGGNLSHLLKETPLTEEEAQNLFAQMATAIKKLHRAGIAHRDIKLNNFLLVDASHKLIKCADFGLSVISWRPPGGLLMARTYCGTEPYMAPEVLRRNKHGFRSYNPMCADVWSLGVCLFAMMTRTFPFKLDMTQRSLFRAQTARRWRFPRSVRENCSEELNDLVWHMLDPEPDRRITMIGVMSHPWLNMVAPYNSSLDELHAATLLSPPQPSPPNRP